MVSTADAVHNIYQGWPNPLSGALLSCRFSLFSRGHIELLISRIRYQIRVEMTSYGMVNLMGIPALCTPLWSQWCHQLLLFHKPILHSHELKTLHCSFSTQTVGIQWTSRGCGGDVYLTDLSLTLGHATTNYDLPYGAARHIRYWHGPDPIPDLRAHPRTRTQWVIQQLVFALLTL